MESLTYLVEVFDHHGSTQNDLQDLQPACVKGKLSHLYELWDRQWTREAIFSNYLSKLTELSGFLITQLGNEDFLRVCKIMLSCFDILICKKSNCYMLYVLAVY
jgi:hypothetical protein